MVRAGLARCPSVYVGVCESVCVRVCVCVCESAVSETQSLSGEGGAVD